MRRFIIACFRVDLEDVSSSQMFENIARSYFQASLPGALGGSVLHSEVRAAQRSFFKDIFYDFWKFGGRFGGDFIVIW